VSEHGSVAGSCISKEGLARSTTMTCA
jgi:hypothetical protein